jgi:uncharacterized protein
MANQTVSLRVEDGNVCERCVVADRPWARMRGLLGRSELPRGEGVILRPARSVHTFFMRFAIDVVFLDTNDVVVDVVHELRPWRAAGVKGARSVVELAAGEAAARGIKPGSKLMVESAESRSIGANLAFGKRGQTMAEYAVVLTVITLAIVVTIGLLSEAVVALIERAIELLP